MQTQSALTAPRILRQGPAIYRFRIGELHITALSDGTVPQDLHELLRDTTTEKTDALLEAGLRVNPVEASLNAFMFKIDERVFLVDTGAGDFFKPFAGGVLLDSLAAAGVGPDDVTDVLLTHAHDDHLGGLILDGKMVFPNAVVRLSKSDFEFFMDSSNSAKAQYDMHYFDEAMSVLKPYADAGKVATFDGPTEIAPGITATIHPGHTPGSVFYTVESQDETIVFVGDIVHVEAVQFPDPTITITYDVDLNGAATTRRKAFADFARERTLIAIPHISFPGLGHVRVAGSGFDWVPVDYGNRTP